MITANWVFKHNLENIYQLCDLYTYVFAFLMILSLDTRKHYLFLFFSILGIFTRQNLVILAYTGTAHLLLVHAYETTSQARHAKKTCDRIHALFLNSKFRDIALIFFIQTACIASLFAFVHKGSSHTLQHITLDLQYANIMLKSSIYLAMPFLLVPLAKPKKFLFIVTRYWYTVPFALITLYQPYSFFEKTGYDNALRLAAQGMWIFHLFCCMLFTTEDSDQQRYKAGIIYTLPFVWAGMVYGEPLAIQVGIHPILFTMGRWTIMILLAWIAKVYFQDSFEGTRNIRTALFSNIFSNRSSDSISLTKENG